MKGPHTGSLRTVSSIRVCRPGPAGVTRVIQGMQSLARQTSYPHHADFCPRTLGPILEGRLNLRDRRVLSGHGMYRERSC